MLDGGIEDTDEARRKPPNTAVWRATCPKVRALLQLPYVAQGSAEWHDMRKTLLTSSDVASAIGEGYRKNSDETLFRSKTNKIPFEKIFRGNYATRWGHQYEPVARREYEKRTGEFVYAFSLVRHPRIPWLGGSCDGITATGRLVEIKCPTSREIRHEVPPYYMPQIQTLLEVLDLEVCDFVQFKPADARWGEMQYDKVVVKRDRAWFANALPRMQAFWDRVILERGREDAYQHAAGCFVLKCALANQLRRKLATVEQEIEEARAEFRRVIREVPKPVRDPRPQRKRKAATSSSRPRCCISVDIFDGGRAEVVGGGFTTADGTPVTSAAPAHRPASSAFSRQPPAFAFSFDDL